MGLDLSVREQVELRTDAKGRNTWTVVELCNLRDCWQILDCLNWKLDEGFSNCGTHSFTDRDFFEVLQTLRNKIKEGNEEQVEQLKYEVECLENFFKQESIDEDFDTEEDYRTFEVQAWY